MAVGKRRIILWFLLFIVVIAVSAAAAGFLGYYRGKSHDITDTGPAVIRLEKLSDLATVRVHVGDVMKAESVSVWGDIKGAWLIKGDALLSVDLTAAKVVAKDPEKKTITLLLPQPRVVQPRIDHNRTVVYDWRKGLLRSSQVANDIWKDAMKYAQEIVERTAGEEDNLNLSRIQAESALKEIYNYVGWTLDVQWEGR